MRILITGAAGFIGSHLNDYLASEHQIVGIDNLSTGKEENFTGDLRVLDIADRQAFYEVANELEPDLVVHCAASYSDPNLWHRDVDTNTTGTINAILTARHHNASLVYFQTALPPISSYAISKIAGEQYINLSGVPALIFRLANIYGPRNVSGPIPTFYKRLSAGQECTVTQTRRDTVYVNDFLTLIVAAIDAEVEGKYDVCSGTAYPIRRYYDAVAATLGEASEPKVVPRPADDVEQMELDPDPAFDRFGWSPETPLEDGIRETVAWYMEHGVGETYSHLKVAAT